MKSYLLKIFTVVFILMVSITGQVAAQCAMCRATIENNVSYGETSVASGLNYGILYLFVTPYLLFMALAYFWYKKSREQKKVVRVPKF